jgi:peptide-methionine (R)-S-oxide reductase
MTERVKKSEEEWREILSDEEYEILRKKGTERAFTGRYWNEKAPGVYRCRACGAPLFSSGAKYESGCGWPSFYEPMDQAGVSTQTDRSHFMVRTEVLCSSCESHLGHVFPDGPQPTGMRYCINSACLTLDQSRKEEGGGKDDS